MDSLNRKRLRYSDPLAWFENFLERRSKLTSSSKRRYDIFLHYYFMDCSSTTASEIYEKSATTIKPKIGLTEFINNKDGIYDKLFKLASRTIYRIIKKKRWKVILKMETKNNPNSRDIYSLTTENGYFTKVPNCDSWAYYLYEKYSQFCAQIVKDGKIEEHEIYTIHRSFNEINAKTDIRYELDSKNNVITYIGSHQYEDDKKKMNQGEIYYKQFIKCILSKNYTDTSTDEFPIYIRNNDPKQNNPTIPKSFSCFNIGTLKYESWGTLMIEADESAEKVYKYFIKEVNRKHHEKNNLIQIHDIILSLRKIDDDFNEALNRDKIKRETEKSAKASIMSRNMSHNLGSHVMYFIRQQLSSPKQIVEGGLVLGDYSSDTIFQKYDKYNGIKQPQLPFLVGLSRFLGYLQERQDYIATMATDYIPAPTTINFKDAVYDELKPDLHYRRHKNADISEPKNLLLDYIAFSEGYTSSDQIIIQFGNFDGEKGDDGLDTLRTINIDIPGGIMGRQAIFSIFENIIRNAAKHCYPRTKDGQRILSLKLNLLDDNDSLITEEIYKNNAKDLHYLSIICNMPNQKGEANKLSKKLGERYINDDGTPNENYKGLKEIRLSAAWLRKYKLDTDIPNTLPPAVIVRATKLTPLPGETENEIDYSKHEAIEYIIALPKPKNIAFLHYDEKAHDSKSPKSNTKVIQTNQKNETNAPIAIIYKDEGKNEGYIYITVNSTDETFLKKTVDDNKLSRYDLIVTDNSSIVDNIGEYVPCRIYTDDSLKNNPLTEELDGAIASSYYKKWLESRFPTIPRLTILDNQAKDFHGERDDNTILIRDNANAPADCYDGTCVFTTHYAGRNNDDNYSKYLERALFVESITGSNSTDRLLRHTPYSDIWLYKHIAASLTKVAIVDERIFSTLHGIHNESTNDHDKQELKNIERWVGKYNNTEEWKKEFYDKYLTPNLTDNYQSNRKTLNIILEIIKQVNTNEKKAEEIFKLLFGDKKQVNNEDITDYRTLEQYQDKGICLFDIKIANENEIEIVGYDRPIEKYLGPLLPHSDNVIAVLKKYNKDLFKIDPETMNSGFSEKFDFICIHQGILDKIYDHFKIKEDNSKISITTEFCSAFGRAGLGQVVIHSGRSIPSSKVMPQQIPFIPLSALDYAVRDCKYTLSELLYTVYSEKRQ